MQSARTTRQIGELLGVEEWQIRRLFELGILSEPPKFGGKRAIPPTLIPQIVEALNDRGWLATSEGATDAD